MIEPNKSDLVDWIWEQDEEILCDFFSRRIPDTMREILSTIAVGEEPEHRLQKIIEDLLMDVWEDQYDAGMEAEAKAEADSDPEWLPSISDFIPASEMERKL
tara:strand:- start:187 stop:492 length:306 start_codon:yes stop_codon:yes gene_type:complete